jgi:hypothetical protein
VPDAGGAGSTRELHNRVVQTVPTRPNCPQPQADLALQQPRRPAGRGRERQAQVRRSITYTGRRHNGSRLMLVSIQTVSHGHGTGTVPLQFWYFRSDIKPRLDYDLSSGRNLLKTGLLQPVRCKSRSPGIFCLLQFWNFSGSLKEENAAP